MTTILIRAIKGKREDCILYLKNHLPQADWVFDTETNAMSTFLSALATAGDGPCVHMEEDIYLTQDFLPVLEERIKERPQEVIQFFSMRKEDLTVGSRYDSNFCMNQCFYLPAGYSKLLLEYYPKWPRREEHPTGYDYMLNDFLKGRKEKYWISIPSLVEHREGKSLISSRRSSKRQSKTFNNKL